MLRIIFKSIYNWIDQGKLGLKITDLPDHGIQRHRSKETRGAFVHGRSIDQRPAAVKQRQMFGHFEADTVLVNVKVKQWRRLLNDLVG